MNRGERALKLVKRWVQKLEEPADAKARLASIKLPSGKRIGFSTIDAIVRGDYRSTPGHDITEALLNEMAKDGLVLTDEAS